MRVFGHDIRDTIRLDSQGRVGVFKLANWAGATSPARSSARRGPSRSRQAWGRRTSASSFAEMPDGSPYRYILLTMDRQNFPGMPKPNWTYGAMYLYGANP